MSTQRKGRPADNRAASVTTPSEDTVPRGRRMCWVPCTDNAPQDVGSQLRRRRAASNRMVRLADCCGAADPLRCHCHESQPPLSEHAIAAWRAAIERTLPIGPPLVPIEVLQRLWRNGGGDRKLAEHVWSETGGAIA